MKKVAKLPQILVLAANLRLSLFTFRLLCTNPNNKRRKVYIVVTLWNNASSVEKVYLFWLIKTEEAYLESCFHEKANTRWPIRQYKQMLKKTYIYN